MDPSKILLLCLIASVGIVSVNSENSEKLDSILKDLFFNPQEQVESNEIIYAQLDEANDLFEKGFSAYNLGRHRDIVKQLVRRCHPNDKLTKCQSKQDFGMFKKISMRHFPAIAGFLKNCFANVRENCAPLLLEKIQQDIGGAGTELMKSMGVSLNFGQEEDELGSQSELLIKSNCRTLIKKLDPRVEFYGLEPVENDQSPVNQVTIWNAIAERCKEIVNKK